MPTIKLDKLFIVVPVLLLLFAGFYYFNNREVSVAGNAVLDQNADDEYYARVLLQEAVSQNVQVTEGEVELAISALVAKSAMTQEEYDGYVLTVYPTLDDFKAKITDNLKILRLIEQNTDVGSINVTDADVDKFIEENREIMPLEQLQNDTEFKDNFYRLARQQMIQNKRQQMTNDYLQSVVDKYEGQ
jgi:hypothetical protein